MDTIIEKIKAIIKENYNIEIEEDEELREKGIDSLRTVQLIVIIEQQFNISFPVESMNGTDLKNVKTISRCIYYKKGREDIIMNRELIFKLSDALLDEKVTVEDEDWELLLGQIVTNRVVGIAYKNLKKSEVKMANEIEQCLKSTLDYNVRKTKDYIDNVKYIGTIMSEASFNYALLKGAYLATKVYEIGNRTSNDIDIFLHSSDLTECQEILEKNGFIQGYFANGEIIPATRREILMARMNYGETVPFLKMVNGNLLELDLNFSLDFKPSGNSEIMCKMLSDVCYVELDDIGFKTLKLTDFIIHLCAHLYKEATTYDWVVGRRDLNLYKFINIIIPF